jgi:arylsulfatase A-like enzyme
MYLWEGGIRIPAIVRWPGVVPAGKVTNQAAVTMDWSATFLEAAGAKAKPGYTFDGESMLAVCAGRRAAFDRTIFWRLRTKPQRAARVGTWKYLRDGSDEQLFNLAADPGEGTNLKTQHADTFDRIRSDYMKWEATMLPL